jgi:predicted RNA-binding protein with RPS1 domain
MSRRKEVLDNEKRLIEKLQKNVLHEMDLILDDETPEELIEAIREAYDADETTHQGSLGDVTTGQPYRLSDSDDFPFGTYIQNQTGKIITKHFRISDEYQIKQAPFLSAVKEMGFNRIYVREFYGHNNYGASEVWEKRNGGVTTLIHISNVIRKWNGKVKKSFKDSIGVDVQVYSNDESNLYTELVEKIIGLGKKRKHESNNIALVIQTPRGYDTTSFELPEQKLDIELGYGRGFKPIHEKIINTLNQKNGKGLVLLHGTPGTGKTHYLKYIASKIKDKRVLFIPPYLADFITSPEMTPFLIQNSNSILFIEDAERVITDRNAGGANGVSNILNITDGILSDILKIQIVATFNMDKAKIDSALLRKGRLIAEHKFDALPVEDANNLLKHLGKDYVTNKPMTLTEIYNVEEAEYKSEEKYSPIGFNTRY